MIKLTAEQEKVKKKVNDWCDRVQRLEKLLNYFDGRDWLLIVRKIADETLKKYVFVSGALYDQDFSLVAINKMIKFTDLLDGSGCTWFELVMWRLHDRKCFIFEQSITYGDKITKNCLKDEFEGLEND